MRDYFMFPAAGRVIAVSKDRATGNISLDLTTGLDRVRVTSWFRPEDFVKQLREVATYVEKYGTDGRTDKSKLQKEKVGTSSQEVVAEDPKT